MSFFKNMDEPGTNDITTCPGYASLPDDLRKDVNNRYESVYNNNQRLGVRIAQGMAFEAAKQMCEAYVAEKHIGWKKMVGKLEKQGHSKESSDKIAGYINAKKNHLGKFAEEESASESPDMMGEGDSEHGYDEEGGTAKGATYESEDCAHCHGAGCAKCEMKEADDYGVTQQAHIPVAYPQSLGGDSDVITQAASIMYNPPNSTLDQQGDPEDKGPKGIQKLNHRMKGMNDTASQNEELDPVIAAAAGYIKHRAEVSGIMEAVDPKKKVATKFKPTFKPTKDCPKPCYENGKHSPMCQHYGGPDSPNDVYGEEEIKEAFHEIGHGDHVTITTPQGQQRKGKAVMKSSHGGWVLNMGGKHGTPGLVDQSNYVKHTKAKNKAPNSLAMKRLVGEEVTIAGEYAKLMEGKEHPLHGIATENGFTKTGTKNGVHHYKKETDSASERLSLGTKGGSHYWEHKRFDPDMPNSAKRTPVSHYSHGLHGETDLDTLKTGLSGQLKSK